MKEYRKMESPQVILQSNGYLVLKGQFAVIGLKLLQQLKLRGGI